MGFLSSIQSHFQNRATGRYIATTLVEIFKVEPEPFQRFLAEKFKFSNKDYLQRGISLVREHYFKGKRGNKPADLAVLGPDGVLALIELKYEDKLIREKGRKPAQLEDYLHRCCKDDIDFLLLYKNPPKLGELKKIDKRGQHAYYGDLARDLAEQQHALGKMLFEYFQEEGLVMEPLEEEYLYRFFHRLLKPRTGSGKINAKESLVGGPRQFLALLDNMRLLAQGITPKIRPTDGNTSERSATIDFRVSPKYSLDRFRKKIKKVDESRRKRKKEGEIFDMDEDSDYKYRKGGRIAVYAQSKIGPLWVRYGFFFFLESGSKRSTCPHQFVSLFGRAIEKCFPLEERTSEEEIGFGLLKKRESKSDLEQGFVLLINKAVRKALAAPEVKGGKLKSALRRIEKSTASA